MNPLFKCPECGSHDLELTHNVQNGMATVFFVCGGCCRSMKLYGFYISKRGIHVADKQRAR